MAKAPPFTKKNESSGKPGSDPKKENLPPWLKKGKDKGKKSKEKK